MRFEMEWKIHSLLLDSRGDLKSVSEKAFPGHWHRLGIVHQAGSERQPGVLCSDRNFSSLLSS